MESLSTTTARGASVSRWVFSQLRENFMALGSREVDFGADYVPDRSRGGKPLIGPAGRVPHST